MSRACRASEMWQLARTAATQPRRAPRVIGRIPAAAAAALPCGDAATSAGQGRSRQAAVPRLRGGDEPVDVGLVAGVRRTAHSPSSPPHCSRIVVACGSGAPAGRCCSANAAARAACAAASRSWRAPTGERAADRLALGQRVPHREVAQPAHRASSAFSNTQASPVDGAARRPVRRFVHRRASAPRALFVADDARLRLAHLVSRSSASSSFAAKTTLTAQPAGRSGSRAAPWRAPTPSRTILAPRPSRGGGTGSEHAVDEVGHDGFGSANRCACHST